MAQIRKPNPRNEPADEPGTVVGMLAEYAHPGALLEAVKAARKEGYRLMDTHTPFPIHGMDKAMGLGPSKIGYFVIVGGMTGTAVALLMHWWMGSVDYPINVGGMPYFAFEPSMPITFELTVLFAAITAVASMFALNRLPRPHNPLFNSANFARATDDAFFLFVEVNDEKFDAGATEDFLQRIGAIRTELVRDFDE